MLGIDHKQFHLAITRRFQHFVDGLSVYSGAFHCHMVTAFGFKPCPKLCKVVRKCAEYPDSFIHSFTLTRNGYRLACFEDTGDNRIFVDIHATTVVLNRLHYHTSDDDICRVRNPRLLRSIIPVLFPHQGARGDIRRYSWVAKLG